MELKRALEIWECVLKNTPEDTTIKDMINISACIIADCIVQADLDNIQQRMLFNDIRAKVKAAIPPLKKQHKK